VCLRVCVLQFAAVCPVPGHTLAQVVLAHCPGLLPGVVQRPLWGRKQGQQASTLAWLMLSSGCFPSEDY